MTSELSPGVSCTLPEAVGSARRCFSCVGRCSPDQPTRPKGLALEALAFWREFADFQRFLVQQFGGFSALPAGCPERIPGGPPRFRRSNPMRILKFLAHFWASPCRACNDHPEQLHFAPSICRLGQGRPRVFLKKRAAPEAPLYSSRPCTLLVVIASVLPVAWTQCISGFVEVA